MFGNVKLRWNWPLAIPYLNLVLQGYQYEGNIFSENCSNWWKILLCWQAIHHYCESFLVALVIMWDLCDFDSCRSLELSLLTSSSFYKLVHHCKEGLDIDLELASIAHNWICNAYLNKINISPQIYWNLWNLYRQTMIWSIGRTMYANPVDKIRCGNLTFNMLW